MKKIEKISTKKAPKKTAKKKSPPSSPTKSRDRRKGNLEVYQDAIGEWRWRIMRGARIIADSGEGYITETKCWKGLLSVVEALQNAAGMINSYFDSKKK